MRACILAMSAFFSVVFCVQAAPPYDGTVWIDPDVIGPADPTALDDHRHVGSHDRSLMWARNPDRWKNVDAHVYRAQYGTHVADVQVNPDFTERRARELAERYARMVGQLPRVLLEAVDEIEINPGDYSASGFHRGWACSIYLYVDQMEAEWNEPFAEEIVAHEAAHCLEGEHHDTSGWRAAQRADPEFISKHAERNSRQEDFAETFTAWMAVRYRPDRLDDADRTLVADAIPNRLAYLDEAIPDEDMAPFELPDTSGGTYYVPFFAAADRTAPGFMRIVNRSARAGTVSIVATDDTGNSYGPVTLSLGSGVAQQFNAHDLESGNPDKGLQGHVGDHEGHWRLTLTTDLDIVPLAFLRNPGGIVMPVPVMGEIVGGR